MLAVFSLTIFCGALLLFGVQPMFARLILPQLGGSPAVWNTAMVFFQAALLAGYAYAHVSTTRLEPRRHAILHFVVLLAPLFLLPLAVPAGWSPPSGGSPVAWLLGVMALTVGLPFLALSTTSPVLQKWFSGTGHAQAHDPYFLYVASNAGSLLSLLAYPILIEPRFTLVEQARWWTVGYAIFVVLVSVCALYLFLKKPPERERAAFAADTALVRPETHTPSPASRPTQAAASTPAVTSPPTPTAPPTPALRWRWLLLSFVPSSLLLGVTTYISTEVAVVPLLWVLPLALYLLTFVLAFARRPWVSVLGLTRALPMLLVPVVMLIAVQASQPIIPISLLHLAVFFLSSWLCHARIAETRPAPGHLTEFYLWMSVGGVLGGGFNALIAPVVFSGIAEYPLMLVLVCLVALPAAVDKSLRARRGDWAAGAGLAVLGVVLVGATGLPILAQRENSQLAFGGLALVCFFFSRRPLRLALGASVLLLTGFAMSRSKTRTLAAERSFFGVHRVVVDETGRFHRLLHGHIAHGLQALAPEHRRTALNYYHPTGPVGQLVALYAADVAGQVAVVGLGAGSMATYARPGQPWTFYEIDPVVLRLASDPNYFTFLRDSPGKIKHVLGDARLSLVSAPDNAFDMLVLDAYSSDAIPVHLLTREAVELYRRKLSPDGVLVFHISNLHLDLEPVLGNLAADAGLVCLVQDDTAVSTELTDAGKSPSVWLVMAERREAVSALLRDQRWSPARRAEHQAVWTDDYSSLLGVVRWN